MSEHSNDVEMQEIEVAIAALESSGPTVSNMKKTNLTDGAKSNATTAGTASGICDDDETGSTVTIGEVGVDEYFDDTFCDDSVVDTTDYREAEKAAAATLLPVLVNMIENGDNASGEASGEVLGEVSEEASGEAGPDYQDKLTDIVRSAHTSIEDADDGQQTASTSTPVRRPLCVVIPREAAIAASQALVSVTPKRRRSGDNDRAERTFLLPGYIDANQSIRKSCQEYGLNLPEAAYDAINLDEHLIRNCYLSILPAKSSIHDILDEYVNQRNAYFQYIKDELVGTRIVYWVVHGENTPQKYDNINVNMFNFLLVAFDEVLPIWCLRRVEQLQHEEISKKFPDRRMCTIYGLIHFLRYSMYLPRLFSRLQFSRVVEREAKIHPVVEFLNGFFEYMVDHGLHIDVNQDYDIMMPSYYQKAYDVLHKTYPSEPSIVIE